MAIYLLPKPDFNVDLLVEPGGSVITPVHHLSSHALCQGFLGHLHKELQVTMTTLELHHYKKKTTSLLKINHQRCQQLKDHRHC